MSLKATFQRFLSAFCVILCERAFGKKKVVLFTCKYGEGNNELNKSIVYKVCCVTLILVWSQEWINHSGSGVCRHRSQSNHMEMITGVKWNGLAEDRGQMSVQVSRASLASFHNNSLRWKWQHLIDSSVYPYRRVSWITRASPQLNVFCNFIYTRAAE